MLTGAAYLTGLAYHFGEPRDAAELAGSARSDQLPALMQNGVRTYRVSDATIFEQASRSVAGTLAGWGGDPGEIDLVMFASDSLGRSDLMSPEFATLCEDNGMKDVPVIGVTLAACAALSAAVRMASSLVLSQSVRRVLIVATDKCPPEIPRIAHWGGAVFSDGAASCLVSGDPAAGGLRLLGAGLSAAQGLRGADPEGPKAKLLVAMANGVRRALQEALSEAGRDAADLAAMVCTSTREDTMRFYAKLCGFAKDDVYCGIVPTVSHSFSADIVASLVESRAWRAARGADRPFLMLAQGHHTWGALVLEET